MKFGVIAIVIVIAIIGFFFLSRQNSQTKSNLPAQDDTTMKKKDNTSKPTTSLEIDKSKKYSAVLLTGKGDITISLNTQETPITANNFITLSKKGFYDDTIFHRVIKGFMIQGGDPKGDGTGGPGYQFNDEPFDGEYTRGTVAMANAGPNTNGSQFFIMHQDYTLPKSYVIFGEVTKGLETVDAIANAPTKESTMGENSSPVTPMKILSVKVVEE